MNFKDKSSNTTEAEKKVIVAPPLLSRLADLRKETIHSFSTARRSIQIYSSSLDRNILSNQEVVLSLTKLIKTNRKALIECLIYDEKELQGFDHRIASLAQKFTSFINIRVVPDEYQTSLSGYYLIDKKHLIYRPNRERFEAHVIELPRQEVKDKTKHFEDIWQKSRPASFLRALHL